MYESQLVPKNKVLSWLRLRLRVLAGKVFNLAGVPGLVRDCDYEGGVAKANITVRTKELFTIITVNGLEIYFHRMTGKIDGVGAMSDYIPDSTCLSSCGYRKLRPI
jgi:hypothetical protein